jgi:uncharacterized protein YjeT (DUF2065 family)
MGERSAVDFPARFRPRRIVGSRKDPKMEYLFTVLGLICFVEGLPYFAFPEALKRWLRQVLEMPGGQLRILGGTLMVMGLILVYLGRRHGG